MTKQEAIDELHKHYVPEYVNYIVTALTDGATPSDAPTINAIPIPEDATNGDVIKTILPFVEVIENEHGVFINIQNVLLDKDWWNAPYKSESEVK